MSIQQNLEHILSRIRSAELRAGRPAGCARLVAVSKTFPADDVKACYDACLLYTSPSPRDCS